jgi:hypothetical protein
MSGWSLKRIDYEAHKRKWGGFEDPDTYHPARDLAKQQDWEWAVDRLARRMDITADQRRAAHRYYEAKMAVEGDIPPERRGMVTGGPESWLERASRVFWSAHSYVVGHPGMTPMRAATFDRLFKASQPTLESVRSARVGAASGRTKQGEAIGRIKWCVEVLANHFDGMSYEEAVVNEKQMGVGEGWKRCHHTPGYEAEAIAALERQGFQVFVVPTSGSVYYRNPHAASVFEPIDTTPQIAALKT